jgi:hypothetical protein
MVSSLSQQCFHKCKYVFCEGIDISSLLFPSLEAASEPASCCLCRASTDNWDILQLLISFSLHLCYFPFVNYYIGNLCVKFSRLWKQFASRFPWIISFHLAKHRLVLFRISHVYVFVIVCVLIFVWTDMRLSRANTVVRILLIFCAWELITHRYVPSE